MLSTSLPAQQGSSFKNTPEGHEKNRTAAASAYEANLKKFKDDGNFLVLPGLVADKKKQRVEVMAEGTGLAKDASCEFLVIADTSSHGYEALLIAFAKPSDVHKALKFLGREPGAPYDPSALRFWAKGETFNCSLATSNEEPVLLEKMIVNRQSAKTLPEKGFLFTGSQMAGSMKDPNVKVYAADEYDPKSIVSIFNSPFSVLDVPYWAPQGEVYENSTVNPKYALAEGAPVTLILEPANKESISSVKNLTLLVQPGNSVTNRPADDIGRLGTLKFLLKDGETMLNAKPDFKSVIEKIDSLDRQKNQYFLTLNFAGNLDLGDIHAVAKIMTAIDSEKGIRIEPPPAGQLYYKAFIPDRNFLDRQERIVQPWELSLTEKNGAVSGMLLLVTQVWKDDDWKPALAMTELSVATPKDLRRELDAEAERTAKAEKMAKPPVILVFAPPTMKYGQMMKFLEPALPTHKTIHVYINDQMPPVPTKK